MRAKSHRQLGLFLAERYLPDLPPRHHKAFLAGCTQPDKNPTTYLKGSIRNRWLHGHDYLSAKRYLFRLARRLQTRKRWGLMDFYRFGKLLHYLADAFTYAHSETFPGNFFDHRQYEKVMHFHFLARLKHAPNPRPRLHRDVVATIESYHALYLKTHPGIPTDIDYCIGVSCLVTEMLGAGIKSEIFSI